MQTIPLVTMLFIAVNLDFFVILLFLTQKFKFRETLIGYELGMLIIFLISAVSGQLIQALIPEWTIGFLGLLPIIMAIKGEHEDEQSTTSQKKGILTVLMVYLVSCAADNLAVYVPVLSTMNVINVLLTAIYFMILTAISLALIYIFGKIPVVKTFFSQWGEKLTRIIYSLIGLFIMFDTGFIQHIFNLLFK